MDWYELLPKILNMSLTASVIIVTVIILRLLLKRAPKVYSYMLWTVVLFRLLCPIAMEQGLTFAIREGGRTVGSGRVATIIE